MKPFLLIVPLLLITIIVTAAATVYFASLPIYLLTKSADAPGRMGSEVIRIESLRGLAGEHVANSLSEYGLNEAALDYCRGRNAVRPLWVRFVAFFTVIPPLSLSDNDKTDLREAAAHRQRYPLEKDYFSLHPFNRFVVTIEDGEERQQEVDQHQELEECWNFIIEDV